MARAFVLSGPGVDNPGALGGWPAFSSERIAYSSGRSFCFYLDQRKGKGAGAKNTRAPLGDWRWDGKMRFSDRRWKQPADLIFQPRYANTEGGNLLLPS